MFASLYILHAFSAYTHVTHLFVHIYKDEHIHNLTTYMHVCV